MNCQATVLCRGVSNRTRQCKNKATVQRGALWYCSIHDPEKANEREDKKRQRWEKRQEYLRLLNRVKYLKKNDENNID